MIRRFTLNEALENKEFIQELDQYNLQTCFKYIDFKDKRQFFSLLCEEHLQQEIIKMLNHFKIINVDPIYRISDDVTIVTYDSPVLEIFEILIGILYPDSSIYKPDFYTIFDNGIKKFDYLMVRSYEKIDTKEFNICFIFYDEKEHRASEFIYLKEIVNLRYDHKGKDTKDGLRVDHSDLQRGADSILNILKDKCIELIKDRL